MRTPAPPADPGPPGFDYDALPASLGRGGPEQGDAIHRLLATTAADVVQVGLRLRFVRERLGRTGFQPWLRAEFCWSQPAASNYMRAAAAFGDLDCVGRLQPSALFLLARKKVPAEARAEAVRLARGGTRVTKATAAGIVRRHAADPGPPHPFGPLRRELIRALPDLPPGEARGLVERLLALSGPAAAGEKSLRARRRRG